MVNTPNHNLDKPAKGTPDWDTQLNGNFDILDTAVEIRDTSGNRSSYDPKPGAKFLETDTGQIYFGDGTDWNPALQFGSSAGRYLTENSGSLDFTGPAEWDNTGLSYTNTATGTDSTVAGGTNNSASGQGSTIGGGDTNDIVANFGTIAGGARLDPNNPDTTNNVIYDNFGTIGGGGGNQAGSDDSDPTTAEFATVAGGQQNGATAADSSIGGGNSNSADGPGSRVGGGTGNGALVSGSTIAGGTTNLADADSATVGGGFTNRATGPESTISGGGQNWATGGGATVSGGQTNRADGGDSTVGGGSSNTASGDESTVGGGSSNTASGNESTVGGGEFNEVTARFATIAGGGPTDPNNPSTTRNVVYDRYGAIGGGGGNQAGTGDGNTGSAEYATVGGGESNESSEGWTTVGGGRSNVASSSHATVAGGSANTASGLYATVGGGSLNTASGNDSTIPGGQYGAADADNSFVWNDGSGYHSIPNTAADGLTASSAVNGEPVAGTNTFSVSAQGGVRFITGGSTVAYIQSGSSSWSFNSSRADKTNIQSVEPQEALDGVKSLDVATWEYKDDDGDGAGMTHIGPMAEDFHDAFDVGNSNEHINSVNADGVAFAAIQGLSAQLDERSQELEETRAKLDKTREDLDEKDDQIEELQAENEELAGRLAAVEEQLGIDTTPSDTTDAVADD